MAEKTSDIERIYTINLRRGWLKEPRSKRSNRAIREIKVFLKRHTKANRIMISKGINEMIFARGFKKPPGKIKVEVKGDLETLQAKIPGEVIIRKEEKKTGISGLRERLAGKKKEGEKEELKGKVEEKIKEATSEEKVKEAVEGVKKGEKESEERKDAEPKAGKKEFKERKQKE
jgi:ribosomal protein L31E